MPKYLAENDVKKNKTTSLCQKDVLTSVVIRQFLALVSQRKFRSGTEFDPHVRHILSWRLGHEQISTAILPLPLIQEEQLSVTGERMCTKNR